MTNRLALNKVNHKIPLDKGDIIMTFHNFFNESLITIIKTINLRRVITRHGFQCMWRHVSFYCCIWLKWFTLQVFKKITDCWKFRFMFAYPKSRVWYYKTCALFSPCLCVYL